MLIAISQRNDENKHGDRIDNLENNYVKYLEEFGIKFLIIPNVAKDVKYYFDRFPIEGVILSGGNDINPKLFGEPENIALALAPERDLTEKKMLDIAIEKRLPVLCICRGMQFMNVYFNGKLTKVDNHIAVDHMVDVVDIEAKNLLGKDINVNSYHCFGITPEKLSSKLKAFAKTSEDIIEGIYHPLLPIAGIQWHPERQSPDKEANQKIINAFMEGELFWRGKI